jgi:hypothetical protein
MRIPGVVALVVLAGAFTSTQAQNTPQLSGCEAPPEVRAVFDTTLSPDSLARLKVKERGVLVKRVIDDLLAKYPREYTVYEKNLPQSFAEEGTPEFDSLRNRWIKNAREHPEDPLALMLASKVLIGKDTPEAIRLLEAAKAKAPEFPWPVHELAALYERGKYADQAKMKENLEKFYSLCPAWTSGSFLESFYLQTDLPLMARTAVALRARLEKETDPRRLQAPATRR